ncbi:unnamed protein product [Oppiella nova]|uniref:Mechanosensitive ion channel protein MscS n=1 Tax=Oppiella nova TaxID=334625 RepID=A0A7R9L727_9ACAR|nr:unnamed protein product [Oppiella nova]CAG2155776.1 unnamed protein product [Oppiella nova]
MQSCMDQEYAQHKNRVQQAFAKIISRPDSVKKDRQMDEIAAWWENTDKYCNWDPKTEGQGQMLDAQSCRLNLPHLSLKAVGLIQMAAQAFIFLTIALAISELLNVFNLLYQRNPKSLNKPIKGYLQLIKLILFIVCGLLILEQQKLKAFLLLDQYLDNKQSELDSFNQQFEDQSIYNQRRLTNIGTFRAYVEFYLKQHAGIAKNQSLIIRQLQPTSEGLPLEIYAFANTTIWNDYEAIQSDIFDHLMAIIPEFGLKIYQAPSGSDLRSLSKHTESSSDLLS